MSLVRSASLLFSAKVNTSSLRHCCGRNFGYTKRDKNHGFSRVMTRPRVGSRGFQNLADRVGSVPYVLKYHGSGRVGSRAVRISRVGSVRVKKSSKSRGSGRVGSGRVGPRGFKISRVGSGRVKRFSKSQGAGRVMTREVRVTRGSSEHDPRVVFGRTAGRTRGSGLRIGHFFHT